MNQIPSFLRPVDEEKEEIIEKSPSSFLKETKNQGVNEIPSFLKPVQEEEKQFPFEGENDLEREIERNIAQQTSRIGESLLGFPGDIYSFAKSLFGYGTETNLPTSASLREKTKELSGGYTEPQTEFEEKVGELQQDIASFMLPGSRTYSLARNIGIPLAANLAKEGVNIALGDKGEEAKIGTMVILDLIANRGKGGAKAYAGSLFEDSKKTLPKGASMNSSKLISDLADIQTELRKGGTTPSKSSALKKIKEIQKKGKNGEIHIEELMEFRKSINELLDEAKAFNPFSDPKSQAKKIKNLSSVKSKVIDSLKEYGKQNKEFGRLNKSANEAWAAYEGSKKISDAIKKSGSKLLRNPISHLLFGALGGSAYHSPSFLSLLGGGAGAGLAAAPLVIGGHESYKIAHQVLKSPTLAKYYGNVLKGAISGNSSQISKNMKKLDEALEYEYPNMVQIQSD